MFQIKYIYKKHKEKPAIALIYYKKLIKASLLISTVPLIVVAILIVYERLTFFEGMIGMVAVFFGSTFFAKPYLDDLSALTKYVEQLAFDKRTIAPPLSFLGNVEELSDMVNRLHESWWERKIQLETALAESGILFDTIPDVLMMLDERMEIVRANNAAIDSLNTRLLGNNLHDIIQDDLLISSIKEVFLSEKGKSIEISFKSHNRNQDYLVMIEKFPVKSMGGIAIVLIMHNITESKRSKQMLKDFVSNASHEIRTPLTSVTGFIENLRDMTEDSPANKKHRKKFLSIMAEQTERMSNLVNDLLSLSKAEINEGKYPTGLVDINDILKSVKRRMQLLAHKKNMKIMLNMIPVCPDVIGDKGELIQVFTNIISNAIKYGTDGTDIEIASQRINAPNKAKRLSRGCTEILSVSIKDEGEGIPEEHISRITERFYRVDKVRSRKIGGTGLGLAITKHILNRHKAVLLIESELGKGSTFFVNLPIFPKNC